jgi:hypothetical protein
VRRGTEGEGVGHMTDTYRHYIQTTSDRTTRQLGRKNNQVNLFSLLQQLVQENDFDIPDIWISRRTQDWAKQALQTVVVFIGLAASALKTFSIIAKYLLEIVDWAYPGW